MDDVSNGVNAELKRLGSLRKEFDSDESWLVMVVATFETLKRYEVISDYHVTTGKYGVVLDVQVPCVCYETVSTLVTK